jgi:L-threonylcarbamoyladenylate synthase
MPPATRIQVDPRSPDPAALDRAAHILRAGGLVAFPTETVYGLGASALDEAAVRRVFQAKGRPASNPLIAHVADAEGAARLVREWPETARRLAEAFWPGPLTLVLPRGVAVPDLVTAGLPDVAVRVPAHPVALAVLQAAAIPVVAPSANRSAAISPTTADHVEKSLGDQVDLILDAGPTRLGIESTVIDLSSTPPLLLRPGALEVGRIESITGPLGTPARGPGSRRHASPGMLERHYAPRARLLLLDPEEPAAALGEAAAAAGMGETVGALLLRPWQGLEASAGHVVRMPPRARAYARRLYAELHRLDDLGCHLIVAEQVPATRAWDAVRDRLRRAAHPPPESPDAP